VSAEHPRKVFLSVAGPDAAWGERIDERLRAAGLQVEYYRRSFPVGTNFIKEINSALASCDCMVALLSPGYCDPRSWVTEEWQAALQIAKRRPGFLVPFLIEQCQLPPLLGPLNYVNLTQLNEEDAEVRLLEELKNWDWPRPAFSGARGPAENTWVAAVHRFERDRLPLGTGVVIDERRVLTCADVVTEHGKVMDPLPWVAFPMAGLSGPQRRQVVGVRLSDDVYELAVLDLAEVVSAGVKAAPLRRPRPEYLVGRGWRAFGFPEHGASGSAEDAGADGGHAAGEVDSVLAYGVLGLDADSRRGARTGFSGAGLWSPDYDAVVGIISRVDSRGKGRAVTLHQADLCFGDDGLSVLSRWSAGQAGEGAIKAWGWAPQEGGYRFQGRSAALTEITGWLDRDRPDRRALVVTGSPGAGKSAVLGRIITTADPGIRAELPSDDRAVRATEGSVACAMHAAGKTALEVATEIARAFSAELPQLSGQLDNLAPAISKATAEQGRGRFNLIIDALDEASRPADTRSIVTQIVRPLLRMCTGAQIVVGSRRRDDAGDLLPVFGNAVAVIDLDAPEYYSPRDMEAYALATLQLRGTGQGPGNPYADEEVARPLAARIAALSRGNFLVTRLTAESHAEYDQEAADPAELTSYAEDAEDALYEALKRALERAPDAAGMSVTTALTALTALAFGEAPGLSCALWSAAVASLPGEPLPVRLQDTQLAGFARSKAGSFVVESSGQDSRAVFGLFHQALNDALLRRRAWRATSVTGDPIREDQQALTHAFLSYGRQAGWASAPPYLLRSLSRHAEPAGLLDELLADDEYLLYADLQRLTPLAAQASTPAGKGRARLLRLTPYAVSAGPQSRRALFSVTEALEKLGGSFRGSPGPAPYRARWSTATTHLERVTQKGHTGGVTELCAYTSGGRTFLVSAGEDEMVRVWDLATGEQQRVLEGHSGTVGGVCAFTSADGRVLLASAGADAMVRVWDPATGEQQRVLDGHSGAVRSVCAFTSADGRALLASAGADATVRVWDPATGEQQRVLEGHISGVWQVCVFTSDDEGTLLASVGDDETVRVWDPATGQQHHVLDGHTGGGLAVCALTSGDGLTLLASAGCNPIVRVWDPATGQQQRTMKGHPGSVWWVCGFTSDDGRTLLASAGDDEAVRVWDPVSGQQQRALEGHTGGAWSVCPFISAGRTLLACASHDGRVRVWDPATGQLQQAFECGTEKVWSVCAFTSAGRTLLAAAGNDSVVRVWDPASGEFQRALEGHTGTVWWICALTSDDGGTLLASAADDETVRVWDPATGTLRQALEGHIGGAWSLCTFASDDGRALLASAGADAKVRVWDPATGELRKVLEGHTAGVWSVCAFTVGGRTLLASCAYDAVVRVWDPTTSQTLQAIPVHLASHVVGEVAGRLVVGLSSGLLTIELNPADNREGARI
jgi:WD40 repeat protein